MVKIEKNDYVTEILKEGKDVFCKFLSVLKEITGGKFLSKPFCKSRTYQLEIHIHREFLVRGHPRVKKILFPFKKGGRKLVGCVSVDEKRMRTCTSQRMLLAVVV